MNGFEAFGLFAFIFMVAATLVASAFAIATVWLIQVLVEKFRD